MLRSTGFVATLKNASNATSGRNTTGASTLLTKLHPTHCLPQPMSPPPKSLPCLTIKSTSFQWTPFSKLLPNTHLTFGLPKPLASQYYTIPKPHGQHLVWLPTSANATSPISLESPNDQDVKTSLTFPGIVGLTSSLLKSSHLALNLSRSARLASV